MSTRADGQAAERHARQWLEQHGLRWIESNYHCRFGEIDIVMQEATCVVFVEVRWRQHRAFGGAAASVDARKQSKLIRTAEHYIATRNLTARQDCRIDVLAMRRTDAAWDVEWIKNAVQH